MEITLTDTLKKLHKDVTPKAFVEVMLLVGVLDTTIRKPEVTPSPKLAIRLLPRLQQLYHPAS